VLVDRHRLEQPADFVLAEDDGQLGLSLRRRADRLDRPVLLEGHFVEKAERRDGHEERAGGELPLMDEMVLIGADVLRTQPLRRPAELPGTLRHGLAVRRLRLLGAVPNPHVLDHPLTKRGHDARLRVRRGDHRHAGARHDTGTAVKIGGAKRRDSLGLSRHSYDSRAAFFLLMVAQRFFCAAEIAARPAADIFRRRRPAVAPADAVEARRRRRRRRPVTAATAASATSGNARVIAAISARSSARRARAPCAANCFNCASESDLATHPPACNDVHELSQLITMRR